VVGFISPLPLPLPLPFELEGALDGYGLGKVSVEEDGLGLDRGTLEIIVGASVVGSIFPLPLPLPLPFDLEGALDGYGLGKVSGEED
jgi:hypothetical protein